MTTRFATRDRALDLTQPGKVVPLDKATAKFVLEEKPGLTLTDDLVVAVCDKLFGGWELNWLALNFAHDRKLPGSTGAAIPFFMYSQGENASGRFDSLDPERFRYRITSRETTA